MIEPDEPLFRELEQFLTGVDNDELIPVLIIACARALTTEADGDAGRLFTSIRKFNAIMVEQAHAMFVKEHSPDGRKPVSN